MTQRIYTTGTQVRAYARIMNGLTTLRQEVLKDNGAYQAEAHLSQTFSYWADSIEQYDLDTKDRNELEDIAKSLAKLIAHQVSYAEPVRLVERTPAEVA